MAGTREICGTLDWLKMVEEEMVAALRHSPPAEDFGVSLVERYHGAPTLENGAMSGFRADVTGERLEFRAGVARSETADVVIDADIEALLVLAQMALSDPKFEDATLKLTQDGKIRVTGEIAILGEWFAKLHDRIYARTK